MRRSVLFLVACIFFLSSNNSYTADKITQHTEGDQAPAVNVAPGGHLTINYGVSGELAADLVPEIMCRLKYPLKLEGDAVRKQIDNPEITITNAGPIKAVAFSVDLRSYLYDKSLAVIEGDVELRMVTHGHFIFKKELQPTDEIKQQVNGYHCRDRVAVYVFSLKYYRETDMKVFNRQDMFFMENYEILSEKDYSANSNYTKIIQAIKSYAPSPDNGKTCLEAIDDRAWVLEETQKSGLVMFKDGGKELTISGIPEDASTVIKQSYINETRPLLYIRPSKLKETGAYLRPKVVDDNTVNIAFRYEVENIGDTEAIRVSQEGGTPYAKPLMPGDKIYLNLEVTVRNTSGREEPSRDLINDMEKHDFFLEHHGVVLYSQGSQDKDYVAKFVYKIGKDSVQLIKYEVK